LRSYRKIIYFRAFDARLPNLARPTAHDNEQSRRINAAPARFLTGQSPAMADKPYPSQSNDPPDSSNAARRLPGNRADVRDVVAELAERAQVISHEAGTKVSAAMKDVISAAAGLAGFAIESARDLVQYMVRRGQMTPEEGERLIREAEAAHDKRSAGEKGRPTATKLATERAAAAKAKAEAAARTAAAHASAYAKPISTPRLPTPSASQKPAPNPVAKTAVSKPPDAAKSKPTKPVKLAKAKASKPAKKKK
jgi:polyhydroxyalkanoate synthesis regulator phasin